MTTPISSISISFLFSACLLSLIFLLSSSNKGYALDGEQSVHSHHHTLQLSSLLPASVCSPSSKDHSKRAGMLPVVHRYGPCSPFFSRTLHTDKDGSAPTTVDSRILSRDQSRVNSIQSRLLALNSSRRDSQSQLQAAVLPANRGLSLGTLNYIVTVGLGTPRKDLSLAFDTGSDLTWTQCQPCARSCYQQQQPIFDPSMSTTYKNITCNSTQCSQLTYATGCSATPPVCIYTVQYGDRSFSQGYFGTETLTLTPTDVFPDFQFGCGQNNAGTFGRTAGLLGLGRGPVSTMSQTASKYGKYFSYCLPSMSSSNGHLTFGVGGSSSAIKFTSLSTSSQGPSFYFIDIMAIKVGGQTLSISPSVFKTAGTIIDSGTVITRLQPEAYTALRSAFRQQMTQYPMAQSASLFDTCYDLSNYSTVSIPTISFYFSGDIEVPINPRGIIYVFSASQVCLAFAGNSKASSVGIFGNQQQQTLEVVYDVAGGKLGFGTGGCS